MIETPKKWATRAEAADYYRIGITTLDRYINKGLIVTRKLGGRYLIDIPKTDAKLNNTNPN